LNRAVIRVVVAVVGAAVAGCVLSAPLTPIQDPTKRLEFPGFSILPPRGPEWMLGGESALPGAERGIVYRAVFFRTPGDAGPTGGGAPRILALVMVRDLGAVRFRSPAEFVDSMKTLGARARQRYKLLSSGSSLVSRPDATCATYGYEAEDSGALVSVQGLRCLHPEWPSYAIELSCSRRSPAGEPLPDVSVEVVPFLGSLVFTPERP
jgi:hypothetical protein